MSVPDTQGDISLTAVLFSIKELYTQSECSSFQETSRSSYNLID